MYYRAFDAWSIDKRFKTSCHLVYVLARCYLFNATIATTKSHLPILDDDGGSAMCIGPHATTNAKLRHESRLKYAQQWVRTPILQLNKLDGRIRAACPQKEAQRIHVSFLGN